MSQPTAATGQSVTVFDRRDIEQVQGADLTRLLERAPGVTFSRNGGPGAFTALRVRGAEGDQLLVLIDGVRVADPASPGGGFDLGNLLMGNAARVELQRSSNSTIWGSQALGGVLAVTLGSEPGLAASAEAGARGMVSASAGTRFAAGPAKFDLRASHFTSDGFSAAAAGTEPDGFRQSEAAGHLAIELARGLQGFASGRYAYGRLDTDSFPAPSYTLADTNEYQTTRQYSGASGLAYSGDAVQLRASFASAHTERANYDPAFGTSPTFTANGVSDQAEVRGRWQLADTYALAFGGMREWSRFATLYDARHETAITGFYAQLERDRGPLHLAAGLRRDLHRDFGGAWSVGADAAYRLGRRWRVTASYGEGFKAPTLFQLHSDYGNSALQPERARSYDIGAVYAGPVTLALTAFRRDTRAQIGFVSCFGMPTGICAGRPYGTYDNVGQAGAQGVELSGAASLPRGLSLRAAYTYLEAADRTAGSPNAGRDLARRPRHALTLSGDWGAGRIRLGADLRVVSASFDDAANTAALAGYAVATVRGEWDASRAVTLFGRVENLFDDHYQTAAGYATAGRGAYLGARARF
ncbi:MAG: TonB-dependent receptor [Croceibacterium sp.]